MGQKNKVAKKRLDKFYYLAKERGYRSRAAFKLLQLDKKYEFLSKAKGVLDLCAAPGSWMQVARAQMPKGSPCIGVDLAAIKPIPKCVALQEDITTQKCRSAIKREMKDAKIDVVLHDGAPNVGTAWLQDAFGQNELVVHALRLACDFMVPGATFVTKAFRSADYNALLYVFQQLFRTVDATKPQASRMESAEIFVVCQGFTSAKIDPKFLDPKHVFAEYENAERPKTNVLQAKVGAKARPDGYDPQKQVIRSVLPVVDFVLEGAPVKALGDYNAFSWDDASPQCQLWQTMPQTTAAVREACIDLKLLGKKDFRMLLTWRLKAAEKWRKAEAAAQRESDDDDDDASEMDEEEAEEAAAKVEEGELTELERLAAQRAKVLKRKEAEKRRRMKERLALKMEHPGDRLDVSEDIELFSFDKIRKMGSSQRRVEVDADADELADDDGAAEAGRSKGGGGGAGDGSDADGSDAEGDYLAKLDAELNAMYADYQARAGRRASAQLTLDESDGPLSKKKRRKAVNAATEAEEGEADPAAYDAEWAGRGRFGSRAKAEVFDALGDGDDDDDDDDDDAQGAAGGTAEGQRRGRSDFSVSSRAEAAWYGQGLFDGLDGDDDEEEVAAMAEAGRAKSKRARTDGAADGAAAIGPANKPMLPIGGTAPGDAPATGGKAAKAPKGGAAKAAKAASGASEAETGSGDGARSAERASGRKRVRGAGPIGPGGMPKDDAKFQDLPAEGGEKVVGGVSKSGERYVSDDEEGEEAASGAATHEESLQASIERQAEAIVLGQMLLRPDKRRALEDAAYNRYTRNDRGLPQWFIDDEKKFAAPSGYGIELDEGMLEKARNGLKDITARTIGKVAEAKARKQRRLQRAMTKIRKKANAVAAKEDLSEREKAREVEKLYKKKLEPKNKKKTLVIGRKFEAGSSGKKGYGIKMVDRRLKKDARAEKAAAKKGGGPKGGGVKKGGRERSNRQKSKNKRR